VVGVCGFLGGWVLKVIWDAIKELKSDTLRKWRVANIGPAYIKLGDGRNSEVRYRIDDVEAFEKSNRFTTDNK